MGKKTADVLSNEDYAVFIVAARQANYLLKIQLN